MGLWEAGVRGAEGAGVVLTVKLAPAQGSPETQKREILSWLGQKNA